REDTASLTTLQGFDTSMSHRDTNTSRHPPPQTGDRRTSRKESLVKGLAQKPQRPPRFLRKERSTESHNARQAPGRTLLVLGVGLLGFVLAQTSVVPALGEMRRTFGASASDITWLVTAYLLVACIATPIF